MVFFFFLIIIRLSTSAGNASIHTKCVTLSNQNSMTQPTLINLHPNEYTHGLSCNPFMVNLDRCARKCDTLNHLFSKVCVPNKTEDLNPSVFNMNTEINELKTLTKHISSESKCKFDDRKCNSNQK